MTREGGGGGGCTASHVFSGSAAHGLFKSVSCCICAVIYPVFSFLLLSGFILLPLFYMRSWSVLRGQTQCCAYDDSCPWPKSDSTRGFHLLTGQVFDTSVCGKGSKMWGYLYRFHVFLSSSQHTNHTTLKSVGIRGRGGGVARQQASLHCFLIPGKTSDLPSVCVLSALQDHRNAHAHIRAAAAQEVELLLNRRLLVPSLAAPSAILAPWFCAFNAK